MKKLLYTLILFLFIGLTQAQNFPISGFVLFTQPSPIYLNTYADASTTNSPIKLRLLLNDLAVQQQRIRLKFYVSGPGIAFQSSDYIAGDTPIYIDGGSPLVLTNHELAPYFEFNNLQGINASEYPKALNEGMYEMCVEVYDYFTGKRISKPIASKTICGMFVLFQNDPPFLMLPAKESALVQQNIQNIVFSWSPRQINVSNVEYELQLVEIWDKTTDPQGVFQYAPPLFTTTTRSTTFQYGMAEPQLIAGKRYAWRVKAKALVGFEEVGVFKNNGYSEVFWFDYDTNCSAPLAVNTVSVSKEEAKIEWTGDVSNLDYDVRYREKNASSNWYNLQTERQKATLTNLNPGRTYEYKVGASCQVGKYVYSALQDFTTLSDTNTSVSCGIPPAAADLSNKTPLPILLKQDVVYAGDYPIVVLHATGGNGLFSGDGYVTFAFLEKFRSLIDAANTIPTKEGTLGTAGKLSRIKVTFNNIGINTDFQLISGEIMASYDKTWGSIADGDALVNQVLGDNGKVVTVAVAYEVVEVKHNPDGSSTLIGKDGQTTIVPKSANDQTYIDSKGNVITVPANGGEPSMAAAAAGGQATAANTNGMSSNGAVTQIASPDVTITFENASTSKYAFDAQASTSSGTLAATYQTIPMTGGGVYKVGYKAVSDLNGDDVLLAKATFKNGKTKDNIVFKTDKGAAVSAVWSGNTATLTVKKTLDFAKESIIAVVKSTTSSQQPTTTAPQGKDDVAGKVNIWHISKKEVNITLLSVNGASIPTDAATKLNEIYNKVGVNLIVKTDRVTIDALPTTIECGSSDLLNTYTAGQLSITSQVSNKLGSSYNDKTYYILYTDKKSSNGVGGFMPLKRQFGFVFDGSNRTLAHELGHGVFGLQHPFSTYNTIKGSTTLLMDYSSGTELCHNDWEVMHAPGLQLYQFTQGSKDGEDRKGDGIDLLGNVIVNVKQDAEDQKKYKIVGLISDEKLYLRIGYEVFEINKNKSIVYKAKVEKNKIIYISDNEILFPYPIDVAAKGTVIITAKESSCTFKYQNIVWQKPSTTNSDEISSEIAKKLIPSNWKSQELYNTTCLEKYYQDNLGNKDSQACVTRAVGRASEIATDLNTIPIALYTGAVEFGICMTEEDQLATDAEYLTKFSYGFTNELFHTIDIQAMAKSIAKVAVDVLVKQIKCITDKRSTQLAIIGATKDQLDYRLKCDFLMSPEDIKKTNKLIASAWKYVKANYTNPYVQGKATFFIASLVVPILGEAKVLKAEQVLSKVAKTEPYLEDFVALSKKLEGKTVEEAIVVLEEGEVASSATRFIAKTGEELKTFLSKITKKPLGKPYNGKWYRYTGNPSYNPTEIYSGMNDLTNRFRKGLYLSESKTGNLIEVNAYDGIKDKILYEMTDVKVTNLLDLTDANTIQELGTTFEQMKLSNVDDAYEFTQEVAIWAKSNGYSGIKFYGAHGKSDYINFVIFEQYTVDNAVKKININEIPW